MAAVGFYRLLLLKPSPSAPPQPPAASVRPLSYIHQPLFPILSRPSPSFLSLCPISRRRQRFAAQENGAGASETLEDAGQEKSTVPEEKQEEVEEKGAAASSGAATSVAEELKELMETRRKTESSGLLQGVTEEVREIEWPAFRKVLGTTGIVLAVIAGSSVALLTINAILAELSDKVFAGRGIQDFF